MAKIGRDFFEDLVENSDRKEGAEERREEAINVHNCGNWAVFKGIKH
jgi:hypothetical protein